ncbi:unnamed protein product [Musa acuminata subsp. burmannicoides]
MEYEVLRQVCSDLSGKTPLTINIDIITFVIQVAVSVTKLDRSSMRMHSWSATVNSQSQRRMTESCRGHHDNHLLANSITEGSCTKFNEAGSSRAGCQLNVTPLFIIGSCNVGANLDRVQQAVVASDMNSIQQQERPLLMDV